MVFGSSRNSCAWSEPHEVAASAATAMSMVRGWELRIMSPCLSPIAPGRNAVADRRKSSAVAVRSL